MALTRRSQLPVLRGQDEPREGYGLGSILSLVRVVNAVNRATNRIAKAHGQNSSRVEVLLSLQRGEGISQQQPSQRLIATKGNICMILQGLEADGLVSRSPDPNDQRAHRLYLTNAGHRLLAALHPAHHTLITRTLAGLSQEERKTLYRLLGRIEQTFDEDPE